MSDTASQSNQEGEGLRCPACGYYCGEVFTEANVLLRLTCRNRCCRKQTFYQIHAGRLITVQMGALRPNRTGD